MRTAYPRAGALPLALLLFPQIVETLYSPALADLAAAYAVTAEAAAQTLSVYFAGFAVGVAVWGRCCDVLGRRPAMIAGLAVYAAGVSWALVAHDFALLLAARAVSAFGAAVGSVVTQTVLRDRFQGPALARVFATAGVALAISPALGIVLGAALTAWGGYRAVLGFLVMLSVALLAWSLRALPETRPPHPQRIGLWPLLRRMAGDARVVLAATLVALWNVQVFAYYALGPFRFAEWSLPMAWFGYSGLALAAGSLSGAALNRRLLARGWSSARLLGLASALDLAGAAFVRSAAHSPVSLAGLLPVMAAFAIAIPQVLGNALADYADCRGSAGAILGLAYYLLIGLGLALIGLWQSLGGGLLACAIATALCALGYRRMSA